MTAVRPSTSLTITNPLVKYQALLATNKIQPDPAQHRLALQLQKLYYRLKDYSPELQYCHRLDQINRSSAPPSQAQLRIDAKQRHALYYRGFLSSLWRDGSNDRTLALTTTTPIQESARTIGSPQGLLLYGEVGRGKSMLLDLFADSLPSRKKRRWHFNTFMLETFARLEQLRIQRSNLPPYVQGWEQEHGVLSLAKDTVSESPILFLDEFQLPDRAASKLLNSFLTAFFHLGGVLVATSNRMPEELAKAAGIEYVPHGSGSRVKSGFWRKGRRNEVDRAAASDFGDFLEVLKARCEVWEMEGERDWRREDIQPNVGEDVLEGDVTMLKSNQSVSSPVVQARNRAPLDEQTLSRQPRYYHLLPPSSDTQATSDAETKWTAQTASLLASPSSPIHLSSPTWTPSHLTVYGRHITVPASLPTGYTLWPFPTLCATNLGPADYISLASTYHTLILDHVPIFSLAQKNEARRFITLLDALYESKCRLLVRAQAGPDALFFPETLRPAADLNTGKTIEERRDEVYPETLSEIYQDRTSPFRPNISSYHSREDASASPTRSTPHPARRSVLADEDADFGPVYGSERWSDSAPSSTTSIAESDSIQSGEGEPDFTKTAALTGEDEWFAYKRARSRIWEMCGERWWSERPSERVEEWWRPVAREGRFWERKSGDIMGTAVEGMVGKGEAEVGVDGSHDRRGRRVDTDLGVVEGLFRHGASPFRTRLDPPPKFGWQHAWGMVAWGRKAGEWGRGVEGRRGRRERDDDESGKRDGEK